MEQKIINKSFLKLCSSKDYKLLLSPYIKLEALKTINASNSIREIVVAWHIEDLVKEVSDLDLYQYCKEKNIILYR
ncbi:MAG: hypothetical protein KUL74_09115, partial [Cloacibacterium sp.]|nr:hypothetical protein [Cloacibacterium sp.]